MKNYAFKDFTFAFEHPLAGSFVTAGQIGLNQVTVIMATEKTQQDVASDGTVQVSAIAGDNGTIDVEMQQTSEFHKFLRNWYNTVVTAMRTNDLTDFASATAIGRSLLDGTTHVFTGISPQKLPNQPYQQRGQNVTWTLMCADIQTLNA